MFTKPVSAARRDVAESLRTPGNGHPRFRALAAALALMLGCGTSPGGSDDDRVQDAGFPNADTASDVVDSDVERDAARDTLVDTGGDAPEVGVPDVAAPDVAVSDVGDLAPAMGCDAPEVAWSVVEGNWWLDVSYLGLSPDNGLVLRGQMVQEGLPILRSTDGAFLGVRVHDEVIDLSTDGTIEAARVGGDIEIRDRVSGAVRSRVTPLRSSSGIRRLELSPSGQVVGVLDCTEPDDAPAWDMQIGLSSPDGAELQRWSLDAAADAGCFGWADHNAQAFDVGDQFAVAAEPRSGVVHVLDVTTGEQRRHQAHDADGTRIAVLHVQIHPDGTEFATVGEDGTVQRWATETLEPIGQRLATLPIRLNGQTFTNGFNAAPVAYSPNGAAFAHINAERAVTVTDLRTGATIAFVEPISELDEARPNSVLTAGIAALAFSADSRSLLVLETGGTQMLSCGVEPRSQGPPQLVVEYDAQSPTTANVPFTVDATTATGFAALDLMVDGVRSWVRPGSVEQQLSFAEPGDHEVTVTLSDGVNAVTDTQLLTTR